MRANCVTIAREEVETTLLDILSEIKNPFVIDAFCATASDLFVNATLSHFSEAEGYAIHKGCAHYCFAYTCREKNDVDGERMNDNLLEEWKLAVNQIEALRTKLFMKPPKIKKPIKPKAMSIS